MESLKDRGVKGLDGESRGGFAEGQVCPPGRPRPRVGSRIGPPGSVRKTTFCPWTWWKSTSGRLRRRTSCAILATLRLHSLGRRGSGSSSHSRPSRPRTGCAADVHPTTSIYLGTIFVSVGVGRGAL